MPRTSMTSKSKLPKTTSPDLCYVYCAVDGRPARLPAARMPEGGPARIVAVDDAVTLVVASVPAHTYAADVLEPRLADLDWVSAAGAEHHQVVDALAEQGASVLPFRLFSLFSSDAAAVATLASRLGEMRRAFDRIRGRQEWVLRIGAPDPARLETDAATSRAVSSGTNFLQAKAAAKREAAARMTRVKEDTAAAFEALEQLADAARSRDVDGAGRLLLDAAFLVPPSRVEALREVLTRNAARLLRDGCRVSLTGPWPPYSFASMDRSHE